MDTYLAHLRSIVIGVISGVILIAVSYVARRYWTHRTLKSMRRSLEYAEARKAHLDDISKSDRSPSIFGFTILFALIRTDRYYKRSNCYLYAARGLRRTPSTPQPVSLDCHVASCCRAVLLLRQSLQAAKGVSRFRAEHRKEDRSHQAQAFRRITAEIAAALKGQGHARHATSTRTMAESAPLNTPRTSHSCWQLLEPAWPGSAYTLVGDPVPWPTDT